MRVGEPERLRVVGFAVVEGIEERHRRKEPQRLQARVRVTGGFQNVLAVGKRPSARYCRYSARISGLVYCDTVSIRRNALANASSVQ